jgi:hypothetical protein
MPVGTRTARSEKAPAHGLRRGSGAGALLAVCLGPAVDRGRLHPGTRGDPADGGLAGYRRGARRVFLLGLAVFAAGSAGVALGPVIAGAPIATSAGGRFSRLIFRSVRLRPDCSAPGSRSPRLSPLPDALIVAGALSGVLSPSPSIARPAPCCRRGYSAPASGVLNAARQSGGALGVALPGALFAPAAQSGQSLRAPMTVAAAGYAVAAGLAWFATRRPRRDSS